MAVKEGRSLDLWVPSWLLVIIGYVLAVTSLGGDGEGIGETLGRDYDIKVGMIWGRIIKWFLSCKGVRGWGE